MTTALPEARIDLEQLEVDPYPTWAALRRTRPVAWSTDLQLWLVTRWDDVEELEDVERFTADVHPSPLTRTLGHNMLHADGEEHRRLRESVAPLLRPGVLRPWLESTVPDLAQRLLAELGRDADLMRDYAEPLPVLALADLLGLVDRDLEQLRAWFRGLGAGAANFVEDPQVQDVADQASAEIDAAVTQVLEGRVRPPEGSLLAILAAHQGLTPQEVCSTVKLMVIGGMQESRDLIGIAIQRLLEDDVLRARVRDDLPLVPRLLEECLRWGSPVGTITRQARTDQVVGGVAIPAGANLAGVIASANRDETRWRDADVFDVDRSGTSHVAFAAGAHTCVGAGIARGLARLAVEAVMEVLDEVRLVEPVEQRGWEFRGPVAIHVRRQTVDSDGLEPPTHAL